MVNFKHWTVTQQYYMEIHVFVGAVIFEQIIELLLSFLKCNLLPRQKWHIDKLGACIPGNFMPIRGGFR